MPFLKKSTSIVVVGSEDSSLTRSLVAAIVAPRPQTTGGTPPQQASSSGRPPHQQSIPPPHTMFSKVEWVAIEHCEADSNIADFDTPEKPLTSSITTTTANRQGNSSAVDSTAVASRGLQGKESSSLNQSRQDILDELLPLENTSSTNCAIDPVLRDWVLIPEMGDRTGSEASTTSPDNITMTDVVGTPTQQVAAAPSTCMSPMRHAETIREVCCRILPQEQRLLVDTSPYQKSQEEPKQKEPNIMITRNLCYGRTVTSATRVAVGEDAVDTSKMRISLEKADARGGSSGVLAPPVNFTVAFLVVPRRSREGKEEEGSSEREPSVPQTTQKEDVILSIAKLGTWNISEIILRRLSQEQQQLTSTLNSGAPPRIPFSFRPYNMFKLVDCVFGPAASRQAAFNTPTEEAVRGSLDAFAESAVRHHVMMVKKRTAAQPSQTRGGLGMICSWEGALVAASLGLVLSVVAVVLSSRKRR